MLDALGKSLSLGMLPCERDFPRKAIRKAEASIPDGCSKQWHSFTWHAAVSTAAQSVAHLMLLRRR